MPKARRARVRKKAQGRAKWQEGGRVQFGKKRFKASSGKYAQVAVLDANTATFGTDLLKVFRENVARAREENMRLVGSPDRVSEYQ
jgi:hypothetical protein